jgi:tellurite resistance protein TerC
MARVKRIAMSSGQLGMWIGFGLIVLVMLTLDLGVFNRKAHAMSMREAAVWSAVWVGLALAFAGGILLWYGPEVAVQFLTGYLIEKALSVDNLFVFVVIFSAFAVPAAYQHRVLFWGVLGALVMRGALIALGTTMLSAFHWVFYLFGAFLIVTGFRMALHKEQKVHPSRNPLVRVARRLLPVTNDYEGAHFFAYREGRRAVTPLLLVVLLIESTDLVFALDSIPAIFAVSLDPFIVYTSNVFAILGLRSLYFLLAGSVQRFTYLKFGLAAVLVLVGAKMLLADIYPVHVAVSLGLVATILAMSVAASLLRERLARPVAASEPPRRMDTRAIG